MSLARIKKNLSNSTTARKIAGKSLVKLRKTEAVSVVSAIMLSDYAPSTKADYIRILRDYFRWLGRPWADQIKAPKIRKGERVRERMISKEDASKIIEMAGSLRNRALLWLLYEGGLRPGEALSLRRKDVELLGDAVRVTVTEKTGTRGILPSNVPFVTGFYS